jgi:DNA ligase-1
VEGFQVASFQGFAKLGESLEATRSRKSLAALVAEYLRSLSPDEVAPASRMIIGRVFPERQGRPLNLSGAAVSRVVDEVVRASAEQRQAIASDAVDFGQSVELLFRADQRSAAVGTTLTLMEVWEAFQRIAVTTGTGSRKKKDARLRALLARATPLEAKYLVKLAVGEMRHGVSEGLLLDGIALAAGIPRAVVRRANMLVGDVGSVAQTALHEGQQALEDIKAQPGRPVKPMLAQTAESVEEAFALLESSLALEYKLDGARVQIHKKGERVWLFSRRLSDLTASLPEVRDQVQVRLTAESAILEGEVIAVDAEGQPLPFQQLMRRLGRVRDIVQARRQVPVRLFLFDLLYVDGRMWIDEPYESRVEALRRVSRSLRLVERMVPCSDVEGERFLDAARGAGHEGLMAKALSSPYVPGVRGRHWLKIKPVVTLDLVIVAADWGYGRRHGWLSNYHLAARDVRTGRLLEVGKTFKGLTDKAFQEMTDRLLTIKTGESRGTVSVRPEVVVEVAFNNIQHSRKYESGMVLRFARIVRMRMDKTADEADTIQTMQGLQRQGTAASRPRTRGNR